MNERLKELAVQAGFDVEQTAYGKKVFIDDRGVTDQLELFAELVRDDERDKLQKHYLVIVKQIRKDEREACAKLCLEPIHYGQVQNNKSTVGGNKYVRDKTAQECAYLIRARGEK